MYPSEKYLELNSPSRIDAVRRIQKYRVLTLTALFTALFFGLAAWRSLDWMPPEKQLTSLTYLAAYSAIATYLLGILIYKLLAAEPAQIAGQLLVRNVLKDVPEPYILNALINNWSFPRIISQVLILAGILLNTLTFSLDHCVVSFVIMLIGMVLLFIGYPTDRWARKFLASGLARIRREIDLIDVQIR